MRSDYSTQWVTPAVKEQVEQVLQSLEPDDAQRDLLQRWLLLVCAASPYLLRVALQYPAAVQRLLQQGVLLPDAPSPTLEELRSEVQTDWQSVLEKSAVTPDSKQRETAQLQVLRQFRHRQLFRILWNDLTGVAELFRTLEDLSILADACVITAEQWSHEELVERFGEPLGADGRPQRLIVLGMGKLGGYELNVSSDIDLIYLFADSGETTGREGGKGVIDNSEFFRRLGQRLTRLLNNTTVDGFVYRVDTRLRPFGESGPLVMNLDGLENYYLTQARDWERYAMIKARAITGLPKDIEDYQALVTPFVYRRYLDYNAFDALRDLKRKIALSVRQKGLKDNIKLGAGGIREVEFIGQAFQLVRGGRDTRLRSRSIVAVLQQLAHQKLLEQEEVDGLLAAYAYLRRVENAVQMMRDEQVHSLPDDDEDRQRLIAIMDAPDWQTFQQTLAVHQQCVSESFTGLFEVEEAVGSSTPEPGDSSSDAAASEQNSGQASFEVRQARVEETWRFISTADVDDEERGTALRQCGFEPDEEMLSAVSGISRGGFYQRLTAESKERVERVVPMIMLHSLDTAAPSATLVRCLALVRTVAGRSGYLQVLGDQPAALARLVKLFSESRWLANFVLRQPMVIDELLIGPGAVLYPDSEAVRTNVLEQLERLRDADLEVQMDSLRHYRQSREMRLACARLDGTLTLMQVSDQLSWLAEALIEVVLELVKAPLLARHGAPQCCPHEDDGAGRRDTSLGIIAYGKLGGLELGFGSDLDLVFLHDSCGGSQQTAGEKSIDNSVFYARLAQKFVHFMSTTTPAGVLYDIDLRLRPNGSSGVLVTGVEAFGNYQRGDAWTWEHQALMRARVVLGSQSLRQQFEQIRLGVLAQPRSESELREAVASMRERMRVSLGTNQSDVMHLKQDAGGVADIEFIVQYLVLAYSAKFPELLSYTDNIRVLDVVEGLQLMDEADVRLMRDSYLELRDRLHRQALQEASSTVPLDDVLIRLRDDVIELKTRVLGPAPASMQ
ncbi:bifunctional [glutamate--ammonia ligase]-adenylyl-L-tyrosine phosphorylase/[glutamate--ammonia-ligase] adenylyltransferase [Granulosicoccus sp. 3-233]|uniref:bifunctional [glutamate--ammonia ligase]-adenylyl-L-tyrosine phosphorylase/[glutamate--ammonia-ligase] adenylyltransferase n=1 Tax=Granulosicoccus sp. 3-233 TaxID=3417969 RepID=UPI003D340EED